MPKAGDTLHTFCFHCFFFFCCVLAIVSWRILFSFGHIARCPGHSYFLTDGTRRSESLDREEGSGFRDSDDTSIGILLHILDGRACEHFATKQPETSMLEAHSLCSA